MLVRLGSRPRYGHVSKWLAITVLAEDVFDHDTNLGRDGFAFSPIKGDAVADGFD